MALLNHHNFAIFGRRKFFADWDDANKVMTFSEDTPSFIPSAANVIDVRYLLDQSEVHTACHGFWSLTHLKNWSIFVSTMSAFQV